jgi:hypothetical protein
MNNTQIRIKELLRDYYAATDLVHWDNVIHPRLIAEAEKLREEIKKIGKKPCKKCVEAATSIECYYDFEGYLAVFCDIDRERLLECGGEELIDCQLMSHSIDESISAFIDAVEKRVIEVQENYLDEICKALIDIAEEHTGRSGLTFEDALTWALMYEEYEGLI